jgi:selenocysteine lyase/cysteine desulfurase
VNILHLHDEENRTKTVIFISAFEHHSNILPWKETGIEVKKIVFFRDIIRKNIFSF